MISKGKSMLTPEKDNRVRIMNDRINFVEKHFLEVFSAFGAYARKLARFRDKNDELAKALLSFSEEEAYSKTTAIAMDSLAKALTIMADYMDIEVQRLETKVINEFIPYENLLRTTRESLKSALVARDKELSREKQLLEIRAKFSANMSAADSELLKAKVKVDRTNKEVDNIIEKFEKRKLKDIKTILLDFILIEMKQHAKSIEILTATYQDVADIDEKKDYQDFRRTVRNKSRTTTEYPKKQRSHSLDHLEISQSTLSKKTRKSTSNRNLSLTTDEELESENKEDENDEEDEDDDESIPPPDQDSESESSDDGSSQTAEDKAKPSPRPKVAQARVPVFKSFCEGVGIPNYPMEPKNIFSFTPRTIQVKSVNGVTKRH